MLADMGVPLLIHQPSYSMLNRWIEEELLDTLDDLGVGCIAFSPARAGDADQRYLDGIPADSRASRDESLNPAWITDAYVDSVRALREIAARAGPDRGADGGGVDPTRSSRDHHPDRREQRRAVAREPWARSPTPSSATTNWPRSTSTPPTRTSTCGPSRLSCRDQRSSDRGDDLVDSQPRVAREVSILAGVADVDHCRGPHSRRAAAAR